MLRLLYLLLDQRLRRRRGTPTRASMAMLRRRPALIGGGVLLLAACIALVGVVARRGDTVAPLARAQAGATLELRVDHMGAAPLVVFLESPHDTTAVATAHSHDKPARVTSINSTFRPAFQVAPLTADIEVANDDAIPHNTHLFDGRRTVFNVATPMPGVRVRKVLRQPGIFAVRCDLHPWMRAWVFVPANPHYAVLWQPGSATLRDIPPGQYRLHSWDQTRGQASRALTLSAGETRSLSVTGG